MNVPYPTFIKGGGMAKLSSMATCASLWILACCSTSDSKGSGESATLNPCRSLPAESGDPGQNILGISLGMSRQEADLRLQCMEGRPELMGGTNGQFAYDANALLAELGEGGYQ